MLWKNGLRLRSLAYGKSLGGMGMVQRRFFEIYREWSALGSRGCSLHTSQRSKSTSSKTSQYRKPTRTFRPPTTPPNLPSSLREDTDTSQKSKSTSSKTSLDRKPPLPSRPPTPSTPSTPSIPQTPSTPPTPTTTLPSSLRNLMRHTPHSVVVITSSIGPISAASYRGITVSSFTTLTLTTPPLITFNIKRPSQTLDAIQESENFLIHILEGNEKGAAVARAFTREDHGDRFRGGGDFGVNWERNISPVLEGEGVRGVLFCVFRRVVGLEEESDHVIVIGKVIAVEGKGKEEEWNGLCYNHGLYKAVGDEIKGNAGKEEGEGRPDGEF